MAIKGIGGGEGFPQIGKIRKGAKKTENRPGKDLEFFRVEFNKGEEDSQSAFFNEFGEQPDEMDVLLPLRMEDTWSYWLEGYARGRMVAKSDGETFLYMRDNQMNVVVRDGLHVQTGEPVPYLGERGSEQVINGSMMKPVGRLKVVVPQLMRRAYLELRTTSYNDCENLDNQIRSIYAMEELMGGIPLKLRRKPYMITVPGKNGQSFRKESYLITIEPAQSWVRWKMLADANHVIEGFGLGTGAAKANVMIAGGVIEGEFTDDTDGDGFENTKETSKRESTL